MKGLNSKKSLPLSEETFADEVEARRRSGPNQLSTTFDKFLYQIQQSGRRERLEEHSQGAEAAPRHFDQALIHDSSVLEQFSRCDIVCVAILNHPRAESLFASH